MKKKTPPSQFGLKKPAILILIILFLTVLGTGAYFMFKSKPSSGSDTIILDNLDPEVSEALSNQIVYTSSSDLQTHYYSYSDFTIPYSSKTFGIADNARKVYLFLKGRGSAENRFQVFFSVEEDLTESSAVIEKFVNDAKLFGTEFTIVEEDDIETTKLLKANYKRIDYLSNEENVVNYEIYVKALENGGFGILEIVEENNTENTESYRKTVLGYLDDLELHPEDLEEDIIYTNDLGGISLEYNRKQWKFDSTTAYSASFSFNISKEENEELESQSSSLYLSVADAYGSASDSSLRKDLDYAFESKVDSDYYKNIEKIEDGEIEFDNVKFLFTQFKYKNDYNNFDTIETVYEGVSLSGDVKISIRTYKPDTESTGGDALEALLNSIQISNTTSTAESSSTDENVLGASSVEFDKAAIIGKPAVVHIFDKSCVEVKFASGGLPNTSGKSYTLCGGGYGSGAFINENGYVLTNAHVASPDPVDTYFETLSTIESYISYDISYSGTDVDGLIDDLTNDIVALIQSEYPETDFTNKSVVYYVYDAVFDTLKSIPLTDDGKELATVTKGQSYNYIQKDKPFEYDYLAVDIANKYDMYETELISANDIKSLNETSYELSLGLDSGLGNADLALLKVNADDTDKFYSVKLEDPDLLSSGQSVIVVGFPGAVESDYMFTSIATTIPTITKGAISAIKTSYTGEYDLVQIDASISGGNSGGPIYNRDGNIVGVATYSLLSESYTAADYNFGVSVEEVLSFIENAGIENDPSEEVNLIEEGLDNLSMNYYKRALDNFSSAIESDSSLEDILNPLIAAANQKIEDGEDETPIFEKYGIVIQEEDLPLVYIVCGVIGLGLLILIILVIIKILRGRKQSDGSDVPPQSSRTSESKTINQSVATPVAPVENSTNEEPIEEITTENLNSESAPVEQVVHTEPESPVYREKAEQQTAYVPMERPTVSTQETSEEIPPELM